MDNKYLVEECFFITPKDVGERLYRVRKLGVNILENRPDITYWFDDMNNPAKLFISINGRESQSFDWELVELTFGEREYFYCSCGHRATKLYLPPNSCEFKCRKCHNLKYELLSFNSKSVAGKNIYKINRLHKLANSRASMSRIFYNGQYTKRFERFLGLCERAGLDSIVQGANDLKTLVNG